MFGFGNKDGTKIRVKMKGRGPIRKIKIGIGVAVAVTMLKQLGVDAWLGGVIGQEISNDFLESVAQLLLDAAGVIAGFASAYFSRPAPDEEVEVVTGEGHVLSGESREMALRAKADA